MWEGDMYSILKVIYLCNTEQYYTLQVSKNYLLQRIEKNTIILTDYTMCPVNHSSCISKK